MEPKALIFDFDGVIVDSNHIKRNSFFELFPRDARSREIVEEILVKYGKSNRKIIISKCLVKLREAYLPTEGLEEGELAEEYARIIQSGVIGANEIRGALKSLEILSEKYPLFINTAAPTEQARQIIDGRGLTRFFTEIYGFTQGTKAENVRTIFGKYKLSPEEVVFIGDGYTDLECALELNLPFIGVVNEENDFDRNPLVRTKIGDLEKLPGIIARL